MNFFRKLEIACGTVTLVMALVVCIMIFGPLYTKDVPLQFLGAVVFFVAPASLVAVGSYFHAIQGRTSGFVMLWLGGGFLTVMFFIHALGGVFYLYGLWRGFGILTPSVSALVALATSLLVRQSVNKVGETEA